LHTATAQGRASARCELLARLALEAARLGTQRNDEELLGVAERSAREAKELSPLFSGHQPWAAQADAALAEVALARGDMASVAAAGRAAVGAIQEAMREDIYPELLLATARAMLAAGEEPEKQSIQLLLQLMLAMTLLRTADEDVRIRWLRGPIGSEWVRLAGPPAAAAASDGQSPVSALSDDDRKLLALLTEGLTTAEIAERFGGTQESVRLKLDQIFGKIGASSRGQATAFALAEGVL
jgi:DNA-binding CsgD family transcriptional regulator